MAVGTVVLVLVVLVIVGIAIKLIGESRRTRRR
jgi:hypothetical protein